MNEKRTRIRSETSSCACVRTETRLYTTATTTTTAAAALGQAALLSSALSCGLPAPNLKEYLTKQMSPSSGVMSMSAELALTQSKHYKNALFVQL
ncbi:hypothetical protein J6590_054553 [Homalodisca vitripennis]|nr:hypothetical protein J6590_054553 [Homalodisca vitripennis]